MARLRHDVLKLLDELSPQVRDAFLASIADITSEAQIAAIAGHLERGNIEAAIIAAGIRPEFFAPLDDALRAAYLRGGAEAMRALPRLPDPLAGRGSPSASGGGTRGRNGG